MEDTGFSNDSSANKKKHDIPLDHLDYKYVEKCEDVKELEKIYRVLASGIEGKYPDLENYVFEKIKRLSPNSRALRKDLPIFSKSALTKNEQTLIDNEIEDFVKQMPSVEKKIISTSKLAEYQLETDQDVDLPPVRSSKQKFILNPSKTKAEKQVSEPSKQVTNGTNSKKSPKPKDYREWEKIEKQIEKELDDKEEDIPSSKKSENKKEELFKVSGDKTTINNGKNSSKSLVKELTKDIKTENLDETTRTLKADQEKCKGNEAYGAGSYHEALAYYTRSISYLPNAASYNNRALTYIKLEEWDKAIDDCTQVLTYENENIKALLRRATALFRKKSYENAKADILKCLSLEPNDKKAQELEKQIEKEILNEAEEKEKLKSIGGNRLKIEETDGSEEEDSDQEEISKVNVNNGQKKQIKIAEVESEGSDEETEYIPETNPKITEASKPVIENTAEKAVEKPIKKEITIPETVLAAKDKANGLFQAGQYGEASEYYTRAIENLTRISSNFDDLVEVNSLLSVLYNNRASCSQHTCDYKSCITDCNTGLELLNESGQNDQLRLKLLFKKATAQEMSEKYEEAFITYENLMKLDSKFKNVQINYNRVRNILNESGKLKSLRSSPTKTVEKPIMSEIKPVKVEKDQKKEQETKSKLYEEFKTKGNDFVKQNNFEKACEFYTKCIDLDSLNPLAYSNRSLCYIKLNQPDLAIKDANVVLDNDKTNVKALYRRALALKLKHNYDLAIQDLRKLLSLESNNQIAKSEINAIEILMKGKEVSKKIDTPKPVQAQVEPESKKVLIKEVETEVKSGEKKAESKEEKEPQQRLKHPTVAPVVNIPKKIHDFSSITNAYEFLQAWNSVSPKDIESYSNLLANVDPAHLYKFIGSKLDDDMLSKLIKSLHLLSTNTTLASLLKDKINVTDYLKSIAKTQRFEVIKLFLSKEQKEMLKELFSSSDESELLKKLYSVKD